MVYLDLLVAPVWAKITIIQATKIRNIKIQESSQTAHPPNNKSYNEI